ncbi:hypothetical protein MIMGU_mgv1a001346mg [Erythranthe guttata]|uniref:Acetyl-coenzyme A synthetase n=1 Tax=Erythranthe guttata TaxID=4155 RepID=A0A022QZB9_ERYGU|nr:hypothetical protein MIMGU_mgv1a001346mg [Erythranthe guttata]
MINDMMMITNNSKYASTSSTNINNIQIIKQLGQGGGWGQHASIIFIFSNKKYSSLSSSSSTVTAASTSSSSSSSSTVNKIQVNRIPTSQFSNNNSKSNLTTTPLVKVKHPLPYFHFLVSNRSSSPIMAAMNGSSSSTTPPNSFTTSNHLRHVESMSTLPSGAGPIPKLNALILGESLASEEDDLVLPSHDFSAQAHVSSPHKYLDMYKSSIEDPAGFWSGIASQFYWKHKWAHPVYSENLDIRKGRINIEWFKGGITNICYNCLDTIIAAGNGEKIAIYWEGNEPGVDASLTYNQLLHRVCQLANYLKDIGVRKGDAVLIYLPMLMELPIAMLACARIGAVHSVVFAGFSSESLVQRIMDCKPKIVITCNAVQRGSKTIHLKDIVDTALTHSSLSGATVDVCLTYENESALKKENTKWVEGRDTWWQDVVPKYPATCDVEWVDAEDPLFLLYTSGSTGKPKGVLHTTGGYMVYTATTFKYAFDYKQSDIYWCTADCGWITGHSYVTYGPLLNGATVVVFEGAPNYPDFGRCWDIVDKYKVSIFYTAPTLVRSLMREGDEHVTRYSRKSLRVLGSVGEPINPSAWRWFFNLVGDSRCPISDTWWQTETGGFMITPLPGAWPQKPGSATFPFFGVQPVIVDEKGAELEGECSGYLCVKGSWPGAFRTLYGDHERYETTYFSAFPGYYFSGDGCSRDKDGYHWLTVDIALALQKWNLPWWHTPIVLKLLLLVLSMRLKGREYMHSLLWLKAFLTVMISGKVL